MGSSTIVVEGVMDFLRHRLRLLCLKAILQIADPTASIVLGGSIFQLRHCLIIVVPHPERHGLRDLVRGYYKESNRCRR